jgi:FKBP-type peptidyl-prolyl cis-trans isomerase SlpA
MKSVVRADSLLTLHYRLALADDTELVSTFGGKPATLQLGSGELAPVLERCLIDLPVGERTVFLLEPEQAFGRHNPRLMQRFVRSELPDGGELRELALVEFATPDGATYTGLVRELTQDEALIDFNHPLAGKAIRFEVEVIGIL